MRHTLPSEAQTAITSSNLGSLLDQIESLQGKIGLGFGKGAIEILSLLDLADDRLKKIQENGVPFPSEEAQYAAIIELYRSQAAQLIRDAGGIHAIEKAREQANPSELQWWWWPERIVSQKRSVSLKKTIKSGAIILCILVVLAIVYQLFLRPDPKLLAAQEAAQSAEQVGSTGDPQKAFALVEAGLKAAPNDADLLILKGCLLTILSSNDQETKTVFNQAEKAIGNHETYMLARGQTFLMLNELDLAKQDIQQLIQEMPKSARAYLILGQIFESQQNTSEAYSTYEKASALATDSNDSVVAAQARIKMGMLMQSMGLFPVLQVSPTPTTNR